MATVIDDKSQHCLPFIIEHYEQHRRRGEVTPPMIVGLQGVQGAGKTTLVEALYSGLSSPPYNISTLVLSIDDLYLTRQDQCKLAEDHPANPLVQHRGVPGTHDMTLGSQLFEALKTRECDIRLPSYDKSAFQGAGDRRPQSDWTILNPLNKPAIDLVILEGWCVGFRSLSKQDLQASWQAAKARFEADGDHYTGQLGRLELASVDFVNSALLDYDLFTNDFSCFIQIDAEDPLYVYDWRIEQEAALRQRTGSGMTDQQVLAFVNGYYPCYELYTPALQRGVLAEPGHQLRLVVDKNRRVKQVAVI